MQAARELGVASSRRAARWTSASRTAASRPTSSSRTSTPCSQTDRASRELHEQGPGARVQLAVAPCSPFSVTGKLMEESAALARRLGLPLHTHLAETIEEDAYRRELYGCTPVEYLERLGWLAGDVVRALRAPARRRHPPLRRDRHRRRALPHVQPAPRCRGRLCATSSTRTCASGSASTAPPRTSAATSSR